MTTLNPRKPQHSYKTKTPNQTQLDERRKQYLRDKQANAKLSPSFFVLVLLFLIGFYDSYTQTGPLPSTCLVIFSVKDAFLYLASLGTLAGLIAMGVGVRMVFKGHLMHFINIILLYLFTQCCPSL